MIGMEMAANPKSMTGLRKDMPLARNAKTKGKIAAQYFRERARRVHLHVMALIAFAAIAQPRAKSLEFAQIGLSNIGRAGLQTRGAFQAFELDQTREREFQLMRIEKMKHNYFVPGEAKMLETLERLLLVVQEVTDDDDDAFAANLPGNRMQDLPYVC
jgi:hypothetical protein